MITDYTSEAGLRNLEREIGAICRKIARRIAEGKHRPVQIVQQSLEKYLGPVKYLQEMDQEVSQVGLATGLAWTQVGGEALYVEASLIKGKGDLILTGQLGEVMQESARAAVTYARSCIKQMGMKRPGLDNTDVHIHVPAGAIPKDGPSAGIAMATALISAITGHPVQNDVAMTGEVTLRGRVLPIGGLKEKALGAIRAGIKTVVIPYKNIKDLKEIPQNVKRQLNFLPVKTMEEVLTHAMPTEPAKARQRKRRRGKAA
jgi:ATP-dependent Lon protease